MSFFLNFWNVLVRKCDHNQPGGANSTRTKNMPVWESDDRFFVDGISFRASTSDYTITTNSKSIAILKNRAMIERYISAIEGQDVRRVCEIGIFEGGMAALLTAVFPDLVYLGVDIRNDVPGFTAFLRKHPQLADRISIKYLTGQDNDAEIIQAITTSFGTNPLDLVIDDASHLYGLSRRSFEICFPLLKPGGIYVLEDWGWLHWPNYELPPAFQESPALSNLVFELVMLSASRPELISQIYTFQEMCAVIRGAAPCDQPFSLTQTINTKGRTFTLL